MPGHEKKKNKAGEDPDPSEYLCVSMDMKREDQSKVYDSKKSFWVFDRNFREFFFESDDRNRAIFTIPKLESRS